MKYKNHNIVKTDTTTAVNNKVKYIYRIEGDYGKRESSRPYITSIKEAKEYINDKIELAEADTVTEYGLSYNTEYESELMADTSNYDGEWQPYSSNNRW